MGVKCALAAVLLAGAAPSAAAPRALDQDTASWWATTAQLSNDAMAGRDTGSLAYGHAAWLVASKFKSAGLRPSGENGSFFQRVPMHEIAITRARVSVGKRRIDLKGPAHPVSLGWPYLAAFATRSLLLVGVMQRRSARYHAFGVAPFIAQPMVRAFGSFHTI